jgi:hypothetical protein
MPNVVFTAPYFTENARRSIAAMARVPGVRLGLVSQEPAGLLPPELRAGIAAHQQVADAFEAGQLVAAAHALARDLGPIDRLLGVVEQLQLPLADARAELGIVGMRPAQARNFRDKARMKALLRAAGVPTARHRLVTAAEAYDFAQEVGYPLVAKPPAGAASQATFRVDGPDALGDALRDATGASASRGVAGLDDAVLLEEFISGEEHSFDTLCVEGRVLFHSITRYAPAPIDAMRNPWIQWTVLLPREVDAPAYDDIRAVGGRALQVLGMGTGMAHMEWFRRPDGSLAISEVAARPPGAQITTLISRAHDFDCEQALAHLMVYDTCDPPRERRYAAGAAFLRGQGRGRVQAIHGLEQAEREVGHLVTDARLPQMGQEAAGSYEGEGYVVLRHPETAVVEEALRRLVALVRIELG